MKGEHQTLTSIKWSCLMLCLPHTKVCVLIRMSSGHGLFDIQGGIISIVRIPSPLQRHTRAEMVVLLPEHDNDSY